MHQTVYLALAPEMQLQLPRSLRDLLKGQGVGVPAGIELAEGPMPDEGEGVRDKDWGIVIQVSLDPQTIGVLGASVVAIIFALSQFLKDRAHEPKVALLDEFEVFTDANGGKTRRLTRKPVLVEPGPQFKAELEARMKKGNDLVVRFKLED